MARFTSIGMPKRTYVASAADDATRQAQSSSEAGPSTASGEPPKKKKHRAGKTWTKKRERLRAIAAGEIVPTPVAPRIEGQESLAARKKRKGKGGKKGKRVEGAGENADLFPVVNGPADDVMAGEGSKKRKASDIETQDQDSQDSDAVVSEDGEEAAKPFQGPQSTVDPAKGWGRDSSIAKKAKKAEQRAEQRRLERIEERAVTMTCFACRGTGHSAKDCPEKGEMTGNVCYRCNSKEHSLSQCRKPVNPSNPTPYANCFVCNSLGHLSSQCPSNEKGVFVNGGKCAKCGSVRHRAGECREGIKGKRQAADKPGGPRTGKEGKSKEAGADEDDFMLEQWEGVRGEERAKEKKRKVFEKKGVNNNAPRAVYDKGERRKASAGSGTPAAASKVVAF